MVSVVVKLQLNVTNIFVTLLADNHLAYNMSLTSFGAMLARPQYARQAHRGDTSRRLGAHRLLDRSAAGLELSADRAKPASVRQRIGSATVADNSPRSVS